MRAVEDTVSEQPVKRRRGPRRQSVPMPKNPAELDALRTIGGRLRQAREMANLSQITAAHRLNLCNSGMLAKIEGATDNRTIPLHLIPRAASLYGVSIDYLFARTDEWDVDERQSQEREASGWLFNAWEHARRRDLRVLAQLHRKIREMNGGIQAMLDAAGDASKALDRFAECNPEFYDMRAGAMLVSAVQRATHAARVANLRMEGFRMDCRLAALGTDAQLSLGEL